MDGWMDSPVFLASRNFQPEYGFSSFCRFYPAVQHGVWGEELQGGPVWEPIDRSALA